MDRTDKSILNNEFWGHVLDHNFKAAKNAINAEKVVVYCEYAYVLCPGVLEISLNRDLHSMN